MSAPHLSQQFETLLQQELDRREFLAYLGAAFLGVIGVSGLIKSLTQARPTSHASTPNTYGASTYGGKS